jgi:predicted nucleotidyltransferase
VAEALDRDAILEELRRGLSDLPSYVKAVLLFGSLARGEAGERSDIDQPVLSEKEFYVFVFLLFAYLDVHGETFKKKLFY